MKKKFALIIITIVSLTIVFFPKEKSVSENQEHPGFFNQWFDLKKDINGEIPEGNFARWMEHDIQMQPSWSRRAGSNPIEEVKELGPTNVAGRTRGLLVHPDNDNEIFAGGISGGLWTSKNGGGSWTPLNDHQASLMVSCITINPFNKKEIYYGTGETRANSAAVNGDGVFKSIDGGKTFNRLSGSNASALRNIWAIEHSIKDSKTIFAGVNNSGVYYSSDAGVKWQKISSTLGSITDIEVFADGSLMCGRSGAGVYKISPGLTGFTKLNIPHTGSVGRVEIEKCLNTPNTIYAAFEGRSSHKVYRSTNGGTTWSFMGTAASGNSYSRYCFDLAVHPNKPDNVMVSSLGIRWSSDGGKSWLAGFTGHADNHSHAYLKSNNGDDMLIGSDGGVSKHKFTNRQSVVRLNSGYKVTQFYAGNYGPTGDTWIAGAQDNGTHRNINGVHRKIFGSDGGYAHINLQNDNIAYLTTQKANLRKTTNFKAFSPTVTNILPSNIVSEGSFFINPNYMNKADGNQVYYRSSRGVWRTNNAGITWSKISVTTGIYSLTTSNEKDPVLYLGGASSRLYRIDNASTKVGTATTSLTANRPALANSGLVYGIEVHPRNNNTIYLAYSNNSNNPRIWKVENCNDPSNLKWINVSGNLPQGLPVNDIALHPQAPDSIMFAATDFGLYYTTDKGANWIKDLRIPSVAIFKIEMRTSDRHAFLFTHGRGVWRISCENLDLPTSIQSINKSIVQVYPNPATNTINIKLDQKIANLEISLVDLNGKQISNNKINNRILDVSAVKPGVYFVDISGKGYHQTEKVIITH